MTTTTRPDAYWPALDQVRTRMHQVGADPMTTDTRLSENPNGLNPAESVWALVELMLGGIATRHRGVPWHVCLRFFDPEARRPGLPDNVGSLVDAINRNDDGTVSVAVQLVNIDTVSPRSLIMQAGAYREHHIEAVEIDGAVR